MNRREMIIRSFRVTCSSSTDRNSAQHSVPQRNLDVLLQLGFLVDPKGVKWLQVGQWSLGPGFPLLQRLPNPFQVLQLGQNRVDALFDELSGCPLGGDQFN